MDCDVLQADGGTRTVVITGGYVALAPVAAVSVGVVDGKPLLDLCYDEDLRADTDMKVVMNREGHFIEVQGTAERQPIRPDDA